MKVSKDTKYLSMITIYLVLIKAKINILARLTKFSLDFSQPPAFKFAIFRHCKKAVANILDAIEGDNANCLSHLDTICNAKLLHNFAYPTVRPFKVILHTPFAYARSKATSIITFSPLSV